MLRLISDGAEALIDPALGAGVFALTWHGMPLLSTAEGRPPGSPFAQGMNLLAPFSNRISGPFVFDGQTHDVPPNLAGEPLAIHGDAFQRHWTPDEITSDSAIMMVSAAIGPFRYDARVAYRLSANRLEVNVLLHNRAAMALPYGGGFHPWFPRGPQTRIQFAATGHWPEDTRHLPATQTPVPVPADWQFDAARPLPGRWINAGFAGWDGTAHIHEPTHRLALTAQRMTTLLVYSPGPDAPFFCLEPVSHPVDAHNLPGQPGLVPLAPGRSLTLSLRLTWGPPDADPLASDRLRKEIP